MPSLHFATSLWRRLALEASPVEGALGWGYAADPRLRASSTSASTTSPTWLAGAVLVAAVRPASRCHRRSGVNGAAALGGSGG